MTYQFIDTTLKLDPTLGAGLGLSGFDTSGMQLKLKPTDQLVHEYLHSSSGGGSMTETSAVDSMGGMALGNGICSAASTLGSMASGIASYIYQSRVMEIQAEMQKESFQFQMDSSEVAKGAKIDLIQAEIEKRGIMVDAHKQLNTSIVNRAKAEGEVAVQKGIKKDAELTKKTSETKINKATIAKMFSIDLRSQPFYGKPISW